MPRLNWRGRLLLPVERFLFRPGEWKDMDSLGGRVFLWYAHHVIPFIRPFKKSKVEGHHARNT